MARNITLTFGLLSFAAKADGAIERPVEMKNLCVGQPDTKGVTTAHEPTPLTAPRTCTTCGPIVDATLLKKGIKQGSSFAVVEQTDVAEAREAYGSEYKGIVSLVPHPAAEFLADTAPGDTVDYVTPADAKGEDHYQLLVKLIEAHPELAFVSLHTPRTNTALYQVTVRDGVLVLAKRVRGENYKPAPSVGGTPNDALYQMLEQVLPTFTTAYDAATYEDTYQASLKALADNAEQTIGTIKSKPGAAEAILSSDDDLMAKLAELAKGA